MSAGILRHVSAAFGEDPVRILRVARFAARFAFDIAPETQTLMREMVVNGEVDALVPERIWQELARGLMEERPSRMFEVLEECGALQKIAPEIAALFQDRSNAQSALDALDAAAHAQEPLEVRFASLARSLDPYAVDRIAQRLKLPAATRDLAVLCARHANSIADAGALSPQALLDLLGAADAWRRPERFRALIRASLAGEHDSAGAARRVIDAHAAAAGVDAGAIAKDNIDSDGADGIRKRLSAARLDAIRAVVPPVADDDFMFDGVKK